MKTYHENNYATYSLFSDIVYIHYKKSQTITLEAAQIIVRDRLHFQNDVSYPVLCNISEVKYVLQNARTYLAFYGSTLTEAVALVCHNFKKHSMGEYFIFVDQPIKETRVFTNEASALTFLGNFKKQGI